ncbi:hypothetical protein [Chryseobacterium vaccae]|uniref:hypothetical protein n=1 Tax=Chryseobacterium vaccae TaxID=2604424 RepID=UPI0012977FC9|nr:hypothetical protein [Chryseobacterium vaccae]
MEFSVTNGQGIIRLVFDGFASCLSIRRPVAVNWPDCRGSVGEYYAVSELSKEEQISMADQLNRALMDSTEEEIMTGIQDFLQLFENGTYQVYLGNMPFDNTDFHTYRSLPADKVQSNSGFFSGWFYPIKDFDHILTLESSSIDEARVVYYMDLIRKGACPKAVVFCHLYYSDPEMSTSFILDGHHKIEAYIRLKMDIPAIFIHKENEGYETVRDLMHDARLLLNDNEFEHLFQNDDENIPEIKFTDDEMLTAELDRILRSSERIDTGIINILIRHHKSGSPEDKTWLDKRFEALRTNININLFNDNKNLLTFSRQYVEKYRSYGWFSKTIKHHYELDSWIRETILI